MAARPPPSRRRFASSHPASRAARRRQRRTERAMPTARPRTAADIRRELAVTEHRLVGLLDQWRDGATTANLPPDGAPSRELLDRIEAVLRQQRGAIDRLHQLWIEYAQLNG